MRDDIDYAASLAESAADRKSFARYVGETRPETKNLSSALQIKRAFDVMTAGAALIFLAPLLALLALLIKLDSAGPVFFSQPRVGLGDKPFRIYKFRTMYCALGDPTGVAQTVVDDPRVTGLGRFLRRSNLDELPQLWNVLIGDMSIVGPRPHAVGMLAGGRLYEHVAPYYCDRHRMRPGITGLAQGLGYRGPTINITRARIRIRLDCAYIRRFSLKLDAMILWKTIKEELLNSSGF
jgi:lipopolysaccharide/colanic/teichoic acid biosynthesis glycosyltransferase